MSLFKATIEQVTGRGAHLFGTAKLIMFNSEGVFNVGVNDSTKSAFHYALNLEGDEAGVVRIESTATAEAIAAYADIDPINFSALDIYEEATASSNTNLTQVSTSNIVLGYDFEGGAIIYVRKGRGVQRMLVSNTIGEIIEVVDPPVPGTSYINFDDGYYYFRLAMRSCELNLDQTITGTDFTGDEGTDWDDIFTKSL